MAQGNASSESGWEQSAVSSIKGKLKNPSLTQHSGAVPLAVPAAHCLEQASQHGGQMVAAHVSVLLFPGGILSCFSSIHLCISNITSPSPSVFSASSLLTNLGLNQRHLSPQGQGCHMAHFQSQRPNSLLRHMLGYGCQGRDCISGRALSSSAGRGF